MSNIIKFLDPVQGLIDYVNDIKPYHTKVIESLVEYVSNENIEVVLLEDYKLDIDLDYSYNINVIGCNFGGYDSLGFDDPEAIPVLSPDPSKDIPTFPAITSNSFTVLGDRREEFNPNSNLTFKIISFIEDRIISVTKNSLGSPILGGSFTVLGDKTSTYTINDIFVVTGSSFNDNSYKITGVAVTGSPITTTLEVSGQIVKSNNVDGFIKTFDSNNNGSFTTINSILTKGSNKLRTYTTVFFSGLTLVPPAILNIDSNQRYVSLISTDGIEYKKILTDSNALNYYTESPVGISQSPDEGTVYADIVNLSQSSPSYFVVSGNFENSNIFVGDQFSVINSTDNNGIYTIESISYNFEPIINDFATTFGVSNIHDSNIDGMVKLDIPSNVFVVDKDYTSFFIQGTKISVITGSMTGKYTTLYSKFVNGETHIRVSEPLIFGRGRLIANTVVSPSSGFVVDGNVSDIFKQNIQFNIDRSVRNNGSYTVSTNSTYDPVTNLTTIYVIEPFDSSDRTGEIHKFVKGILTHKSPGFGQTPELCNVVPETIISVNIKDTLYIDGIGISTYDDIIAYGINSSNWGYDLPAATIFSATQPNDPIISSVAPSVPVENDLWFDTSLNTGSPSAPGTLKQYGKIIGSPQIFDWIIVQNNKVYWIDTNINYMYYRIIYQHYDNSIMSYPIPTLSNNLDTGWILEYTKIPGYNDQLTGNGTRQQIGIETYFARESSTSIAETTFTLSTVSIPLTTGSPTIPDKTMLEVYVNNTIANVDILSTTTFNILSPRLRVGDLVEARVFADTATASSSFVGAFDTNAAIVETFDMLLGYRFYIDGTDSSNNTIHIPDVKDVNTGKWSVYDIFMQGSPPVLVDNIITIEDSQQGSPNNDGVYTILSVAQQGSPINHVVLTVAESLLDSGIFSTSPAITAGNAIFQRWFQYFIVNTGTNSIVILNDATNDIKNGDFIKIIHSNGSPNNDGIYTVSGIPIYDGRNTTITTTEIINNVGNSGGWVESI